MSPQSEKLRTLSHYQEHPSIHKTRLWLQFVLVALGVTIFLLFTSFYNIGIDITISKRGSTISNINTRDIHCRPYLPSTLARLQPLASSSPPFRHAISKLDKVLEERVKESDMDSLVMGVVGPEGLLWSKGYGVANANDTSATQPPNEHSIYRVASISKLFATLETFILRDRGLLSWDDPVTRFFPSLTYRPHGWSEHLNGTSILDTSTRPDPITLRQLASHMSGIGLDYPVGNLDDWPHVPPPPFKPSNFFPELTYPSKSDILEVIANSPLVVPQYTNPVYSNTGYSLLGWCNTVAHQMATGHNISYAELLKRDIFQPLGMNGSSFVLTDENKGNMVYPKDASEAAFDMTDSYNPAAGQMSSLSDLAKTAAALLKPDSTSPLLSPYSIREWVRPLHVFPDRFSEVGLAWEILQFPDRHGRMQHYYSKAGNLHYYHSRFTINQELGYGIIVMMSGRYPFADWFVEKAVGFLQPVFVSHLEIVTRQQYGGLWYKEGDRENNQVELRVKGGILWVTKWIVGGDDYIQIYNHGSIPLWSTGRLHEFRAPIGRDTAGCWPYWANLDTFHSHHAPINLILFEGDGRDRVLRIPSAKAALRRDV